MKRNLHNYTLGVLACVMMTFATLFTSCSTKEAVEPTEKSTLTTMESAVAGPYTVTFAGVSEDGKTWSYNVERTGPAQGNGLSHLIIDLGTCMTFSNVVSASIDGVAYTNIKSTEGSGTGCVVAEGTNFIKFDDLSETFSTGVHKFSITLDKVVAPALVSFWVKPGNACYMISAITGPGCEVVTEEGCSLSMGYWFAKPGSWSSKGYNKAFVMIGGQSYSEAESQAIWNSSNKGGMKDAKMAFLQISAIKLTSEAYKTLPAGSSVWNLVTKADNFLISLKTKLATTTNNKVTVTIPTTADANKTGGATGNWIDANHCY